MTSPEPLYPQRSPLHIHHTGAQGCIWLLEGHRHSVYKAGPWAGCVSEGAATLRLLGRLWTLSLWRNDRPFPRTRLLPPCVGGSAEASAPRGSWCSRRICCTLQPAHGTHGQGEVAARTWGVFRHCCGFSCVCTSMLSTWPAVAVTWP